jgi:photosystem II stability/assembly factor-like uncharacterized protein
MSRCAVLVLLLASVGTSIFGQWEGIGGFRNPLQCIYFIEAQSGHNVGFVGLQNGTIVRTSDYGRTWNTVADSSGFGIGDFTFKDSAVGWCARRNTNVCLQTTDGGLSWQPMATEFGSSDYKAIYYHKHTKLLLLSSWNGLGIVGSYDEGKTWKSIFGGINANGFAFSDSLHGICTREHPTSIEGSLGTSDGGRSWFEIPLKQKAWQPAAVIGTPYFFAVSHEANTVVRSSDYGQSWETIKSLPGDDLAGTVRISGCNVYVLGKVHFYFSRDNGQSWSTFFSVNITDSTDYKYLNFFLNNDTLFLLRNRFTNFVTRKKSGVVYRHIFPKFIFPWRDITAKACSTVEGNTTFENQHCNSVQIDSVWFASDSVFTVSPLLFPIVVPPKGKVNIPFRFSPNYQGYVYMALYMKLSVDGRSEEIMTSIRGISAKKVEAFTLPYRSLDYGTLSTCKYWDSVIMLRNEYCRTITIDTVWLRGNAFGIVSPLQFHSLLEADAVLPITVRFQPDAETAYADTLHVRGRIDGKVKDTTIFIRGKGSKESNFVLSNSAMRFKGITPCVYTDTTIALTNPTCEFITIDEMWISNSTAFTIQSAPSPILVGPGSTAQIILRFAASSLGNHVGSLYLRITSNGVQRDMVIVLDGKVSREQNSLSASTAGLHFDTTLWCESKFLGMTLENTACDSLYVEVLEPPTAEFVIIEPQGGVWLHQSENLPVIVQFTSPVAGTKKSFVSFTGKAEGGSTHLAKIDLTGEIQPSVASASIAPSRLVFDTLTCNERDTVTLLFTSFGQCELVQIQNGFVDDSINFEILSPKHFPINLSLVDTLPLSFIFKPTAEGTHRTLCHLHYLEGVRQVDTTIELAGVRTGGSMLIASDKTSIDFGATTVCEELDSVIVLNNMGCDTLIVTDILASGSGFRVRAGFPIVIVPGGSEVIQLETTVDATGGALSNSATLTIMSNADNAIAPIPLSRSFTLPPHYDIGLSTVSDAGTAGETATLQLLAGSWWKPDHVMHGVEKIEFDLAMNNDLLQYESTSGPNTIVVNGSHVTIAGTPEIVAPNGVLAEFNYSVRLTKDTVTDIQLTALSLNDGAVGACLPTIQSSGAGFTYRYACGDRAIQQFLGMSNDMEIISIRPNPASDEVTVAIAVQSKEPVRIEIYDVLGKLVYTYVADRESSVVIPLRAFSPGNYVIRMVQGSETASKQFVIER